MRVRAVELVAYGVQCDRLGCDKLFHARNETHKVAGFYLHLTRVTEHHTYESEELFFCSKDCMLDALQYQASSMTRRTT